MRSTRSNCDCGGALLRGARKRFGGLLREQRGSALIESAVGLSLLFMMVLGVTEASMMAYTYSVYADAARAGARYATIHGTSSTTCSGPSTGCGDSTAANVSSAVTAYVTGFTTEASDVNVSVSYPDSSSAPPSRVVVTVSYKYKSMFALPVTSQTFSASASGRILY